VTAGRRRGLLLLSVALASGGLAASQVHERERRAARELGPAVDVVVAARDLRAGARITPDAIGVRRVPERFVPADVFVSGAQAAGLVGARVAVPVAAGSYVNAGLFEGREGGGGEEVGRRGERQVTVGVAGGGGLEDLAPGARVDVLVSTETGPEGGRTVMALAGAELLRIGETPGAGYPDPDAGGGAVSEPTALATLRVSLRQAIYLTAADNFAREIRLLPRPPGDPSRAGGTISQGQL
jgi:pilus assembly protein CpaB